MLYKILFTALNFLCFYPVPLLNFSNFFDIENQFNNNFKIEIKFETNHIYTCVLQI